MARTSTVRPTLRSVLVGAVLALVLGSVPLVVSTITSSPAADAHPYSDGYWRTNSTIHYGTSSEWNDPSHIAYAGPGPLNLGFQTNVSTSFVSSGVQQDRQPDPYVDGRLTAVDLALTGIPDAYVGSGGDSFAIICPKAAEGGPSCRADGDTYTLVLTWRAMARSGPCEYARQYDTSGESCPEFEITGSTTRTVVNQNPPGTNTPPNADFEWAITDRGANEVSFANTSTDLEGDLSYAWDFDDGQGSTEEDPVHTYDEPGTYEVTLDIDDGAYASSVTRTVDFGPEGLVVNSTGDDPATDPDDGCDTGGTVGDDDAPECTLRAAIQTADAEGGGDITFDIDAGGVPTIEVSTALPAVSASTTIDGSTQPGGAQVELTGPATADGLVLSGGTSRVEGLTISGFGEQVAVTGGTGHTITGNVLAADPTGTIGRDGSGGVRVTGANGVVVDDNVIGAVAGVLAGPTAGGLQVTDNAIGVGADGAALGTTRAAVAIAGPTPTITGNTLRGEAVGAFVAMATATGATVSDNRVGLSQGGVPYDVMGYGIRIDGAPGATVTGNTVVSPAYGAIVASGSYQAQTVGDEIQLNDPDDEDLPGAVTGGGTTITGNTVAIAGSDGDELGPRGIASWAGAAGLTVTGNTVGGVSDVGIELVGGSGHRVAGNTVGSATAPARQGITVEDAPSSTVGGPGPAGNTLSTEYGGIEVGGTSTGARVQGNTVRAVEPGTGYVGIDLPDPEATGATVDANVAIGGETGIGAKAPGATIRGNRATDQTQVGIAGASLEGTIDQNVVTGAGLFGIGSLADRATVSTNTVVGGTGGIGVNGIGVEVTDNRVGLAEGSSTVAGNTGTGIVVEGGKAVVQGNQVAGSGELGIDVLAAADATLRSNRIWRSTGAPVRVADGPDTPLLLAAVRTGSGETLRRTLVISDLPTGDAGTLEVFANSSCTGEGGGEAELLMAITRTKEADEVNRIIQIKEQPSRDHFTVTYTDADADGRTSQLSNCESGDTYPDGDGDGAPDPLDGLAGFDDDPTSAVVATDGEQLLLVSVLPRDPETTFGGGQLEAVGGREDPIPDSHPAGWSLPYGPLGFRITGLEPGARTGVYLTTLTGDTAIGGDSYWKYGPATPGAASSWYRFDQEEGAATGATLTDAAFVGGEVRRAWLLVLGDGLRGDSDGGANGTITDPGGPVIGGDVDPVDPEPPTEPTVPTTPTTPTPTPTPTPTTTGAGSEDAGGVAAPVPSAASLPRTGSDASQVASLGLALVLLGFVALLARRRPAAR